MQVLYILMMNIKNSTHLQITFCFPVGSSIRKPFAETNITQGM
jgi:hypothetical protein